MEVEASPKKYILEHPFPAVLSSLASLDRVDSHSAGLSPVTVRWLTKGNTYVNIGLVEVDKKTCELVRNMNSFGVTDEQMQDLCDSIGEHMRHDGRA